MRDVTLVRVPGSGADDVQIDDRWNVQQFVDAYQLHGRDIVMDGRGIPSQDWDSVTLYGASEIFAVAPVKGN